MKNEKPKLVDVEVVSPTDEIVASSRGVTGVRHLLRLVLSCPPVTPVKRPSLPSREVLESSFFYRHGYGIIFTVQSLEYFVSPAGILRSFTKLFLGWFLILTMLAIAIGVPLLIAAQFLESIAILIESAMKHFFFACLWLVGSICVLALLIAGIITFINSKNSQRSHPRR